MVYEFDFFDGNDGQTYLNIKHVNGQTLYTSEGYTTKQAAVDTLENFLDAIRSVSLNFADGKLLVARYSTSTAEAQS